MKNSANTRDESHLYLKGRPVSGPHLYDLESYGELRNETLKQLEELKQYGGLLLLPFHESAERTVLIFLNLLAGKILAQGKRPFYSHFLGVPYLEIPDQPVDIWIIHNAPRFLNMFDIMEPWIKPGRVLLATGMPEMWERYLPRISFLSLPYFVKGAIGYDTQEKSFQEETKRQLETDLIRAAYHLVALCDAWGVPLPFDLLAKLLKADPDEFAPAVEDAYQKGILFWVEREKPWALLISTRSETHARRYLTNLPDEEKGKLYDAYQTILESIDPESREERFTILKLIESWLAHSHLRTKIFQGTFGIHQIRNFINQGWDHINRIIEAGNNSEKLLWTKCLGQLGLFLKSLDVFEKGLRSEPQNAHLLQAKAHLLSQWSYVDPRKREEASQAFSKAVNIISDNPYLWQAWGVFEAERGNRDAAERYFAKALEIDPRNLCTLVAIADMNLEMGFFDEAEKNLNRAKQINANNLYVQHLEGRLFFYRGKWSEANRQWKDILKSQKKNLYALHSLGHMARERGLWVEARKYLEDGLSCDPENVPLLQERGLLEMEMENGSLKESERLLSEALTIEPGNPKTVVSLAVAERLQHKIDSAIGRLQELIEIWPDNVYALHTLALCYIEKGQREVSLQLLQKVINLSHGRNPLPVFTMTEMAIRDGDLENAKGFLRQAKGIYESQENILPVHKKISTLLERAHLLHQMGMDQEAKKVLNEALAFDSENQRTRKLLSELGG